MKRLRVLLAVGALAPGVAHGANGGAFDHAVALYQARQFAASRVLFQAAATAHPGDREIEFYLGRIALWFSDCDEAVAHLEAAAAAAPDDACVQNALGDLYGLRAQDAPLLTKPHWACKCRAAYERAIALDPKVVRFRWSLLGFCLVAPSLVGGGIDRARTQAAEIARLDEMQGRVAFATIALQLKLPREAFAQFDGVLERDPEHFLALYQVGRCAAVSGEELDRGLSALRRCLALPIPTGPEMPTRANVYQRLGDILSQLGDRAGARSAYATVQTLEPDFRPQKWMLRY